MRNIVHFSQAIDECYFYLVELLCQCTYKQAGIIDKVQCTWIEGMHKVQAWRQSVDLQLCYERCSYVSCTKLTCTM